LAALTEWWKPQYPEPTVFRVPIDKENITWVKVRARFLDDDDDSANDVLASFYLHDQPYSYQDLAKDLPEGSQKCYDLEDDCNKYDDGCGKLQYCLSLEVKELGP
jgi:hypothetical protein